MIIFPGEPIYQLPEFFEIWLLKIHYPYSTAFHRVENSIVSSPLLPKITFFLKGCSPCFLGRKPQAVPCAFPNVSLGQGWCVSCQTLLPLSLGPWLKKGSSGWNPLPLAFSPLHALLVLRFDILGQAGGVSWLCPAPDEDFGWVVAILVTSLLVQTTLHTCPGLCRRDWLPIPSLLPQCPGNTKGLVAMADPTGSDRTWTCCLSLNQAKISYT